MILMMQYNVEELGKVKKLAQVDEAHGEFGRECLMSIIILK